MQNAFIESFNGRLRDELLNETLFTSLAQARVALGCWRADYNDARPHSQLGKRPPSSPSPVTRAGIWRFAMPKAPRQLPSLPPPNRANPTTGRTQDWIKLGGKVKWFVFGSHRQTISEWIDHESKSGARVMRSNIFERVRPFDHARGCRSAAFVSF